MKKIDLIHRLAALDKKGVYILSKADIGKMFPGEGAKAMEKSLQRMVADRLLIRAARGIYVNPAAASRNSRIIEDLAQAPRPGGTEETLFGTIEFTHTKRPVADILAHTQRIEGRPLRIAHKMAAVRDL